MRAYIDSDILIGHLRGDPKALHFLKELQEKKEYELWIGAIQRAEIVFFMRKDEEKNTLLFLSQFKTAMVDQSIVDAGGILFRKWNPTHGTDINDALLAATVKLTGGKIYGLNKKHYPMPEIIFEKPF
jgi:predicted nucleic acid-binding protein